MSFLSVLKTIGHGIETGLGVAQQAAPIVNLIPGGGVVETVIKGIVGIEQLFPQSGLGAAKSTLVAAAATAAAPGIDPAALQAGITSIVTALNALEAAASKATPPPAAPAPAS
jgi:hypothetical protein